MTKPPLRKPEHAPAVTPTPIDIATVPGGNELITRGTQHVTPVVFTCAFGQVDWTAGMVQATGAVSAAERTHLTLAQVREMALTKAQLNLTKTIGAIPLTATQSVQDRVPELTTEHATRWIEASAPTPVLEHDTKDGGYQLTLAVSLYGAQTSLAARIPLPMIFHEEMSRARTILSAPTPVPPMKETYTGVIIQCRNTASATLLPALCPLVLSQDGQVVYPRTVDWSESVNRTGLVTYASSIPDALKSGRVGTHPLLLTAMVPTETPIQTNLVLSPADTERLLAVAAHSDILETSRVVIVVQGAPK